MEILNMELCIYWITPLRIKTIVPEVVMNFVNLPPETQGKYPETLENRAFNLSAGELSSTRIRNVQFRFLPA